MVTVVGVWADSASHWHAAAVTEHQGPRRPGIGGWPRPGGVLRGSESELGVTGILRRHTPDPRRVILTPSPWLSTSWSRAGAAGASPGGDGTLWRVPPPLRCSHRRGLAQASTSHWASAESSHNHTIMKSKRFYEIQIMSSDL
jgi:hypothetical protein